MRHNLLWCRAVVPCAIALCICLATGCVYKGAKVIEGTDVSMGISVPGTEGAADLSMLNYLSGFRLAVAENAALTLTYTTAETNSFLGVVSTATAKSIKATVEPCEVAPAAAHPEQ